MSERAGEVPFTPARGGHRGRDLLARVRGDPGLCSCTCIQDGGSEEAAAAKDRAATRWEFWAILARMGDYGRAAALKLALGRGGLGPRMISRLSRLARMV